MHYIIKTTVICQYRLATLSLSFPLFLPRGKHKAEQLFAFCSLLGKTFRSDSSSFSIRGLIFSDFFIGNATLKMADPAKITFQIAHDRPKSFLIAANSV
jgi:hypothetical protein